MGDAVEPRKRTHVHIEGAIEAALVRHVDGDVPPVPELPKPLSFTWGDIEIKDADFNLIRDGARLTLEIGNPAVDLAEALTGSFLKTRPEGPAIVMLVDGRRLVSRVTSYAGCSFGFRQGQGGSLCLKFVMSVWLVEPLTRAVCWIARLPAIDPGTPNLSITGGGWVSSTHLRVDGTYTLFVVGRQRGKEKALIVDTKGLPFEDRRYGNHVRALEVALGRSFSTEVVLALDEDGAVVGLLGFDEREHPRGLTQSPVPDGVIEEACWMAPFFTALVATLEPDEENDFHLATAVLLDSLTQRIDTAHLTLQVALEAFCAARAPASGDRPSGSLVQRPRNWEKWVAAHAAEIEALANNPDDACMLLNRIRSNAIQRPTSRTVPDVLKALGIVPEQPYLDALEMRGKGAHRYSMSERPDRNWRADLVTIDRVRAVFVAALARVIGYRGPIQDWSVRGKNNGGTNPSWWTYDAELPSAWELFDAGEHPRRRALEDREE